MNASWDIPDSGTMRGGGDGEKQHGGQEHGHRIHHQRIHLDFLEKKKEKINLEETKRI